MGNVGVVQEVGEGLCCEPQQWDEEPVGGEATPSNCVAALASSFLPK